MGVHEINIQVITLTGEEEPQCWIRFNIRYYSGDLFIIPLTSRVNVNVTSVIIGVCVWNCVPKTLGYQCYNNISVLYSFELLCDHLDPTHSITLAGKRSLVMYNCCSLFVRGGRCTFSFRIVFLYLVTTG